MSATVRCIDEVPADSPIALLTRRRVFGEQMLWAHVNLAAGCSVAMHSHVSEQIAFIISGRVRWLLGEPGSDTYRELEAGPGTVVELPSDFAHGVVALEDSVIIDGSALSARWASTIRNRLLG